MRRRTYWIVLGLMFLVPAVASQFSSEMNWDARDFIVFAALLIGIGVSFELIRIYMPNRVHAIITGLGVITLFFLAWLHLAVGIIGS